MIQFKITPHMVRGNEVKIVEVWMGQKMVATIYPQPPNRIRLISNHIYEHKQQLTLGDAIPEVHEYEFYPR